MGFMQEYNCVVQPGHLAFSVEPSLVSAVAGSGVVVTLRDRRNLTGALAHCVYPKTGAGETPTHYHADVAIHSAMKLLKSSGTASPEHLEAQMFGGAVWHGIGRARTEQVLKSVKRILKDYGVTIVSEDIGGSMGRKIIFNTCSGETLSLKTRRIRRTDWMPELEHKHGFKRVAFKRRAEK